MDLQISPGQGEISVNHMESSSLYDPSNLSPYSSTTSSSVSPGTSSMLPGMMYPEYSEWPMPGVDAHQRQQELVQYGHHGYMGYSTVNQPELISQGSYWQSEVGNVPQGMGSYSQHIDTHRLYPSEYASVAPSSLGNSIPATNINSSSNTTKSGKPKRKRVQSVSQRKAANIRERRRMFHLNEAFDNLRKRLPAFNYEKRLSRIETLRLAMTYISFMKEISDGVDPKSIKLQSFKETLEASMFPDSVHSDGSLDDL